MLTYDFLNLDNRQPVAGNQKRRYGQWIVLASLALLLPVGLYNYAEDPFFIFGNSDTPLRHLDVSEEYFAKRLLLQGKQPETVIIGNSKAARGIDAQSLHLAQPAFNYGLPGSTITMHRATLEHTLHTSHPKQILIMLDFLSFNSHQEMNQKKSPVYQQYTRHMLLEDSIISKARYYTGNAKDYLWGLLSLRALHNSLADDHLAITENKMKDDGSWVYTGEDLPGPARFNFFLILHEFVGKQLSPAYRPGFAFEDSTSKNTIKEFELMLDSAYQTDTAIVIAINPIHATSQIAIHEAGFWPIYENWKKQVVEVNHQLSKKYGKTTYPVWDFSIAESYNASPVKTNSTEVKWHYEPVHFTPALGEIMLANMLGNKTAGFGENISTHNIDAELEKARCAIITYRKGHPREFKEVKNIVKKYFPTEHQANFSDACTRVN